MNKPKKIVINNVKKSIMAFGGNSSGINGAGTQGQVPTQ